MLLSLERLQATDAQQGSDRLRELTDEGVAESGTPTTHILKPVASAFRRLGRGCPPAARPLTEVAAAVRGAGCGRERSG
jgi:hypothetical protein